MSNGQHHRRYHCYAIPTCTRHVAKLTRVRHLSRVAEGLQDEGGLRALRSRSIFRSDRDAPLGPACFYNGSSYSTRERCALEQSRFNRPADGGYGPLEANISLLHVSCINGCNLHALVPYQPILLFKDWAESKVIISALNRFGLENIQRVSTSNDPRVELRSPEMLPPIHQSGTVLFGGQSPNPGLGSLRLCMLGRDHIS